MNIHLNPYIPVLPSDLPILADFQEKPLQPLGAGADIFSTYPDLTSAQSPLLLHITDSKPLDPLFKCWSIFIDDFKNV